MRSACRAVLLGLSASVLVGSLQDAAAQDTTRGSGSEARSAVPDADDGRRYRPEIEAVTIRGAHAVPEDEIATSIVTAGSRCRGILYVPFCVVSKAPYFYQRHYLDRDELRRDVLRIRVLYWRMGYRLASVDTAVVPPTGTKARITFVIHEGPPTLVSQLQIEPESLVVGGPRSRVIRIRAGRPLDLNALDSTVTALQSRLWDLGFADATADTAIRVANQPPSDSATLAAAAAGRVAAGTATVTITIDPHKRATIDTVLVSGNHRVSAQTIRHAIVLQPHSLFLRRDVQRSQRALYQTNLFRRAAIAVDSLPGKPDSAKQVLVNVDEGPTRESDVGVGFTTADFAQLSGRFANYNWVGGARQLVIDVGVGNLFAHSLYTAFNNGYKQIPAGVSPNPYLAPTWQVAANVTQPWFLAAGNALGLGLFAHRRIAPGVYIDNAYGATATFTHHLADRLPLSLSYRYSVSHVNAGDVYFCVDYGVCDAATRAAIRSRARLSPVILGAQLDRSNDLLNPTSGFLARAELQYASQFTASDFRYTRAFATGSLYRPVGRSVLAFKVRVGVVGSFGRTGAVIGDTVGRVLHPTVRFYAGGAQSVRGFGENQLGPRVLTIGPEQLRGQVVTGHDTTYLFCPPPTAIADCDPNKTRDTVVNGRPSVLRIHDSQFAPQPLGGRTLLEGSVEYRFPIFRSLGGAVFVDAGVVGLGNLRTSTSGTSAVTPGFGVRYYSFVGPIRVDLGLNPLTTENLTVLTEDPATRSIAAVHRTRVYAPARTETGLQGLLNRFSLHLSIGQAF